MEINWLIIFTTAIFCVGTGIYVYETLIGKTKPNRVAWTIWGIAPLIGSVATFVSEGFVWAAVPIFMMGIMDLLVVAASFVNKNSYWKLQKTDYYAFALAVFGLLLWGLTSNPLLAIVSAVAVDSIGGFLIVKKIYQSPETENIAPFIGGVIANGTALFFVTTWRMEEFLFPLYVTIVGILAIFFYYRKRVIAVFNK